MFRYDEIIIESDLLSKIYSEKDGGQRWGVSDQVQELWEIQGHQMENPETQSAWWKAMGGWLEFEPVMELAPGTQGNDFMIK